MSGFLTILKNDARIVFKDYKVLTSILLMPVIVILIFSSALAPLLENESFVEPFNVVIVDKDKSPWTGLLGSQLETLEIIDRIIYTDEEEAKRLILNNQAAAAIVLPENLADSIDYLEPKDGKVIGSTRMYLESRLVRNIGFVGTGAVSAGLASINVIYEFEQAAGYSEEKLFEEINKSNQAYMNLVLDRKSIIKEGKYRKPDISPIMYYALSLLGIFIMFSSIPCMKLLTEEKRMGILSRLNAGPVKSRHTVLSKLLVSFMVSSIQFGIIIAFALSAGEKHITSSIGAMLPVFLATTLAAGAFSMLVASIAKTGSAADLIVNLSILLMAVVGGSLYPLSSLPAACRFFSVITINRWASEGFMNVLYGDNPSDTMRSVGALILLSILFITASIVILRAKRRRLEG